MVITGPGAVTPLGTGVKKSWEALCAGTSGVTRITRFDATGLLTQVAGEVKDFRPEDFVTKKLGRRTDRFQQFAMAAAQMAVADAGLGTNHCDSDRIGVCLGTILHALLALT